MGYCSIPLGLFDIGADLRQQFLEQLPLRLAHPLEGVGRKSQYHRIEPVSELFPFICLGNSTGKKKRYEGVPAIER
jgi:hypothetical protein